MPRKIRDTMNVQSHFFGSAAKRLRVLKVTMVFIAAMFFIPQDAAGRGRWLNGFLPGGDSWNMPTYSAGDTTVTFKLCVYDAYSDDAGFEGAYDGAIVQFSKDGGNSFKQIFVGKSNQWGDMSVTGMGFKPRSENDETATFICDAGLGTVHSWWGSDDNRWVTVTVKLNRQWLNSNIIVKAGGYWVYYLAGSWQNDPASNTEWHICSQTIQSTFTHLVRPIYWNGDCTVSPDGTVTVPYGFNTIEHNTDGETHICTMIDGSYSGNIG